MFIGGGKRKPGSASDFVANSAFGGEGGIGGTGGGAAGGEGGAGLGVVDFGLCARLPDGLPPAIGRLLRIAMAGDGQQVLEGLRAEGFVKPRIDTTTTPAMSRSVCIMLPVKIKNAPIPY